MHVIGPGFAFSQQVSFCNSLYHFLIHWDPQVLEVEHNICSTIFQVLVVAQREREQQHVWRIRLVAHRHVWNVTELLLKGWWK